MAEIKQKMSREARNHMRKMNNLRKKEIRRKEAEERNSAWASLSTEAKIFSLQARRGSSKKQMKKLGA